MEAFGLAAAGAIANALDFARERRVALALTRGFVPGPLPELEGFDAGLVFEPSGHAAGGGDFFGIWRLPNGSVALLVGDVSAARASRSPRSARWCASSSRRVRTMPPIRPR